MSKLDLLIDRAKKDDPNAQCELGIAYCTGNYTDIDYSSAYDWLSTAAKTGNPTAKAWLGWLYNHGLGIQINKKQAITLYEDSIKKGDPYGHFFMAMMLFMDCGGSSSDQANSKRIAKLTKYASDMDLADANAFMAALYDWGFGVETNTEKSVELWDRAAHQGVVEAQFSLGACYTDIDINKAYFWFKVAQINGDKESSMKIKELEIRVAEKDRSEIEKRANDWVLKNLPESGNA